MRDLFFSIKDYIQCNFSSRTYIPILIWIAVLVSFNYYLDFEDSYIDVLPLFSRIGAFTLFQGLAFIVPVLIISVTSDRKSFLSSREFWFKFIVAFIILGVYRGFSFRTDFCSWLDSNDCFFLYKVLRRVVKVCLVIVCILPFYYFFDREKSQGFYGISLQKKSIEPYLYMLLGMAVILFGASFIDSVSEYYPMYKRSGGHLFATRNNIAEHWVILMFEIPYGFGFIAVELFFRGFLIFSFSRLLGEHVVLPMATVYAVLHFGKPLPETLSSVLGGYILGIVALRTKNINGGIVVHAGVALMMELFAFMQIYFQ
ncbi:CPBP family intramembrane glutamic endopeptidase [Sediminitomix flava]|uniref:CAAX prenyl protease-like protein n=1 Tax=Sediminitomix flava TaxID=379075 RepID=A0A315ZFG4_SEDFL|nr:CPBP family intramembrane glutamic endopeptidase [Sediminitomix flava]PWJ44062.1 CAAX prenyl protease-like protein [Sediminitomix flava]